MNRSDPGKCDCKKRKNAQGMSKKVILSVEPNAFGLALNTASIWPGCHQASDPYCQVPAGSIEELLPSVLLIASTSIPAILVLRLSSVMQFSCVLQCGSNFRALFVGLIVSASDASGPTTPLSTRGTCRASFGLEVWMCWRPISVQDGRFQSFPFA